MFSIRVRLALWYSAILLCGFLLLAVLTSFAIGKLLMSDIDASLNKWVNGAETVLTTEASKHPLDRVHDEIQEYSSTLPEGSILRVRDAQNREFFGTDSSAIPTDRSLDFEPAMGYSTVRIKGRRYRMLTSRVAMAAKPYLVQLAISLANIDALQGRFRDVLFWTIPGILVIASLGGLWISSRALSPVDAITYAARAISLQNLSQRLNVPRTHDQLSRLSQTWNEMLDRLESAVKRLSQFTADASHELRSPVTLIRTTTEIALSQERSADQYRAALEKVMGASLRVSKLIEDLLELARADVGRISLPLSEVDLSIIAREVHAEMRPLADDRKQNFLLRTSEQPARIMGNSAALRRLLIILVDNAIKFTPEGGRIEVGVEQGNSAAIARISDSGIGIPSTAVPHIFERFFRADTSRTPLEGAGLGLSIAQAIAHAHSGRIDVASESGSGSVFSVHIPSLNSSAV
jgi:heavy metal sensor kinase